ncbi:type II secretion system protein GspM [Brevundimonas sp. FT23042]|uniref:type II secretion system protein GspM n=1 Tax=Brevundimonas sp. FT23042 TaxID=3393749 RepID=UPI003B5895EB
MNVLLSRVHGWWDGRTVRERRLLAVMLVLIAGVLAWLAVVRPVQAWQIEAADRRLEAEATLVEVRSGLARIAAPTTPAPANAEGLEPLVRRTAGTAGLAVVTTMAPDGGLGIQMSQAPGRETFVWLAALEADHGVRICSLGVTENADATLNLDGSLGRNGCSAAG